MPSVQPAGIAAFAQSFGDAFANGQAMNMRAQLAAKAQQDAMISDTLVKAFMDNPDLANDNDLMKLTAAKIGKDNANIIAQTAMAFNRSPLGVLRKGFSGSLVAPDAPPEGPVFNPMAPDARPEAIRAVVGPRIAETSPMEMAFAAGSPSEGVDSQAGFLQAKTQDQALIDPTTGLTPAETINAAQKAQAEAAKQRRWEIDTAQKKIDVDRRIREQKLKMIQGSAPEIRQTRVGERTVRRWVDPETGTIYVAPIGGLKQASSTAGMEKTMGGVNEAITLATQAENIMRKNPQDIADLFAPFIGQSLNDIEKKIQASPGGVNSLGVNAAQKRFLSNLLALRNARLTTQGGMNLTENESKLYNEILPSDLSQSAALAAVALEETQRQMLLKGAINETVSESNRRVPIPTRVLTQQQRQWYKQYRRASKYSWRDAKNIPLQPGEVLFDGDMSKIVTTTAGQPLTLEGGPGGGPVNTNVADPALDALWNQ